MAPFTREKKAAAHRADFSSEEQYPYKATGDDALRYDEDLPVVCPAHTTEKKLMARVDLRVIPCLCVLYLLAFLDRVNIANAAVYTLQKDLDITTGNRYNNCLVIFFIPYILFEIPSNILLKRFSPHMWLSGCMFLFGVVSVCQGLVQNYSGLLATRFFLGLFETGMFPGCFYLIGMWYKREEAQRRYSFFFGSTTLAGAFGGLLASAIGKLEGVRGLQAWRWIFILEGILTCVVAMALYFLIPDFPENAKWLAEDERDFIKARLQVDQGRSAVERHIGLSDVGRTFKDFKVIVGGFMYFGLIVPAYGYAYFAPSIIRTFKYSPIQTQLHSVPPWAAAFAFAMILAYTSDLSRHRFAFALLAICVSIAGFSILLGEYGHRNVEYAALFLITMGTYSALPIIVCWFQMNLGGHHRRAVGAGWQIGFGNIGGIIAVYSFLKKDAPTYTPGYSICIAFAALSGLSCCVYFVACSYQNRRRDRSAQDVGLTEYEKTEMGDLSPDYRYLL